MHILQYHPYPARKCERVVRRAARQIVQDKRYHAEDSIQLAAEFAACFSESQTRE